VTSSSFVCREGYFLEHSRIFYTRIPTKCNDRTDVHQHRLGIIHAVFLGSHPSGNWLRWLPVLKQVQLVDGHGNGITPVFGSKGGFDVQNVGIVAVLHLMANRHFGVGLYGFQLSWRFIGSMIVVLPQLFHQPCGYLLAHKDQIRPLRERG
jgi:hypothetical protein